MQWFTPHQRRAELAQGLGANAITGRRYNPSVTAFKSLIAVPVPLTQGSRDSLSITAAKALHREARTLFTASVRKLRAPHSPYYSAFLLLHSAFTAPLRLKAYPAARKARHSPAFEAAGRFPKAPPRHFSRFPKARHRSSYPPF